VKKIGRNLKMPNVFNIWVALEPKTVGFLFDHEEKCLYARISEHSPEDLGALNHSTNAGPIPRGF
jgi:hypothetical protein